MRHLETSCFVSPSLKNLARFTCLIIAVEFVLIILSVSVYAENIFFDQVYDITMTENLSQCGWFVDDDLNAVYPFQLTSKAVKDLDHFAHPKEEILVSALEKVMRSDFAERSAGHSVYFVSLMIYPDYMGPNGGFPQAIWMGYKPNTYYTPKPDCTAVTLYNSISQLRKDGWYWFGYDVYDKKLALKDKETKLNPIHKNRAITCKIKWLDYQFSSKLSSDGTTEYYFSRVKFRIQFIKEAIEISPDQSGQNEPEKPKESRTPTHENKKDTATKPKPKHKPEPKPEPKPKPEPPKKSPGFSTFNVTPSEVINYGEKLSASASANSDCVNPYVSIQYSYKPDESYGGYRAGIYTDYQHIGDGWNRASGSVSSLGFQKSGTIKVVATIRAGTEPDTSIVATDRKEIRYNHLPRGGINPKITNLDVNSSQLYYGDILTIRAAPSSGAYSLIKILFEDSSGQQSVLLNRHDGTNPYSRSMDLTDSGTVVVQAWAVQHHAMENYTSDITEKRIPYDKWYKGMALNASPASWQHGKALYRGDELKVAVVVNPQQAARDSRLEVTITDSSGRQIAKRSLSRFASEVVFQEGEIDSRENHELRINAELLTSDGRSFSSDSYSFEFVAHPWVELRLMPNTPDFDLSMPAIKVPSGATTSIPIEIVNDSEFDFLGYMYFEPGEYRSGLKAELDKSPTAESDNLDFRQIPVTALANSATGFSLNARIEEPNRFMGGRSITSSGISESSRYYKYEISLQASRQQTSRFGEARHLKLEPYGEAVANALQVQLMADPGFASESRIWNPDIPHKLVLVIRNTSDHLLLIRDIAVAGSPRIDVVNTRTIKEPDIYGRATIANSLATDIGLTLAGNVTISSTVGYGTEAYMEGHYHKALLDFSELTDTGICLQPNSSWEIEYTVDIEDQGSSTEYTESDEIRFSVDVRYFDAGSFSSGSQVLGSIGRKAETAQKLMVTGSADWLDEYLKQSSSINHTPPAHAELYITIQPSMFKGSPLEGQLRSLEDLGYRTHNLLNGLGTLVMPRSPIEIHIYDRAGNHVGPTDSGYDLEIPGFQRHVEGHDEYVFNLESSQLYDIQVVGTGVGTYGLDILAPGTYLAEDKTLARIPVPIQYRSIPVSPGDQHSYDIDAAALNKAITKLVSKNKIPDFNSLSLIAKSTVNSTSGDSAPANLSWPAAATLLSLLILVGIALMPNRRICLWFRQMS